MRVDEIDDADDSGGCANQIYLGDCVEDIVVPVATVDSFVARLSFEASCCLFSIANPTAES